MTDNWDISRKQTSGLTTECVYDKETGMYVSQSDIKGLVIETKTRKMFWRVYEDVAKELIQANHKNVT